MLYRTTTFQRFIQNHTNGSILLFLAAVVAMIIANSPLQEWYNGFLQRPVIFQINRFHPFEHDGHHLTLLDFVNDALMAVFFFTIGLEIKKEILVGELSSFRKASLPVIAACGGMIIPVLCYLLVCPDGAEAKGMAIPMATDIAFALGVLSLLGKRVPIGMKVFLTALAVADDIGGILVIAFFYSTNISLWSLVIAFFLLFVLFIGGKRGITSKIFYYVVGFFVWLMFLDSGVHPTISGVLAALTIPARPKIELQSFIRTMRNYADVLSRSTVQETENAVIMSKSQIQILKNIESHADQAISPLQDMVDDLEPIVNFIILPLFAFVNAGVSLAAFTPDALTGIPLAVFLGLVLGKTLGIFGFSYFFIWRKWIDMPKGMNVKSLFAVSMLGGIGFTVALFIAALSFASVGGTTDLMLDQAKIGVFAGSLTAGLLGYFTLKIVLPANKKNVS